MYKLVFFVPETHLESVKLAVFEAGARHIGNYDKHPYKEPAYDVWQLAELGL